MQNPYSLNMNAAFSDPYAQVSNPYDFTGTDANGTYAGGGQMPVEQQVRHQTTGVQNPQQSISSPNPAQVWTGTGYHQFAPIPVSSVNWQAGSPSQWINSGDSGYWSPEQGGNVGISDRNKYGIGSNPTNFELGAGENTWQDYFDLKVKSADKEGTNLRYVRQGDYYVPEIMGTTRWDTNNGAQNTVLATMAAMAAGGLAAQQGAFGSTAQGAFSQPGMVPWEMSLTNAMPGAGLPGMAGAVPGGGSPGPVAESFPVNMPGSPQVSNLPNIPGTVVSPGSGIPGLPTAGSGGLDRLRQIVGGISNIMPGGGNNNPNSGNGAGNGFGSLAGLIAALTGSSQSSDYARDLRSIADEMRTNAQPYMDRLRQSYEDPNAYFNSPDVQARLGLETNRLTGIDSSRGRLSNPIERDMLLQKYAAKDIGDYRSGLNNSIQKMYQPLAVAELLSSSSFTDNARFGDLANWFTQGGGNFSDLWGDIEGVIEAGGDLWDFFSGWWD